MADFSKISPLSSNLLFQIGQSRLKNEAKQASAELTRAADAVSKSGGKMKTDQQYKKAEEAATQFEALLLKQMLDSMWKTLPKEGLLSGSREESLYRDMLTDTLSKDIAQMQSIGIKDVILRELKEREGLE